jgi:tRNA A37 threonylcarbamoyladenosine dehydratase
MLSSGTSKKENFSNFHAYLKVNGGKVMDKIQKSYASDENKGLETNPDGLEIISSKETERIFSRNILVLSKKAFGQIAKEAVAIIGIGGVGSVVAEQLVRLGVRSVTIAARGHYDFGNINRQLPATYLSVKAKTPKIYAMKERLYTINPWVNINTINCDVVKDREKIAESIKEIGIKIVFNCVDEYLAQNTVADISRKTGAYMILGGVTGLGLSGIATTFQPGGISYVDLFGIDESSTKEDDVARGKDLELKVKKKWLQVYSDEMPAWLRKIYSENIGNPYPVLTPVSWTIASILTMEFVKVVTRLSAPVFAPKAIQVNTIEPKVEIVNLEKQDMMYLHMPWRP